MVAVLDVLGGEVFALVQGGGADGLDDVSGFGVRAGDVEVGDEPGGDQAGCYFVRWLVV